ncbi:MAG: WD40 repeat domain-containing protein [Planctomycetales bacterium]|nr:WD40 repeat domain-containing protein [Planctomycetales bacterium]
MLSTAARLDAAQELAQSRQQTAETAQFFRLMQEAATLNARHEPGWTWKVEELLARANELPLAVRDDTLVRETILACQTSFDLRHLRTLGDQSRDSRDLPGSMAFSSDGRYFAFGQSINEVEPKLYVYDTSNFDEPKWTFSFDSEADTQRRIARGDKKVDNGYRALGFSPDNHWLAAGTRFGKVLVYDLTEPSSPARELDVLEDAEVKKVAFSHDSKYFYALITNQLAKQWEDFEKPVSLKGDIKDLAVDPTGRRMAMSIGRRVEVQKDLDSPFDLKWTLVTPSLIAFSADGRKLAVTTDDGVVQYDLTHGPTVQQVISHSSGSWEVGSLRYDGRYLLTGNGEWIRVEATSGQLLYRIPTDDFMLAMDPQGQHLAVRSGEATQLFKLKQPPTRKTLIGFTDSPDNVAFIGSTLTAKTGHGAKDVPICRNYILQWNCETGEQVSARTLLEVHGLHAYPRQGNIAVAPGLVVSNCQPIGLVTWRPFGSPQPVEILTPLGQSISLGTRVVTAVEGDAAVSAAKTPDGHSKVVVVPRGEQITLRITVPVDDLPRHWHRMAVTAVVNCKFVANSGRGVSIGFILRTSAETSVYDWRPSEFVNSLRTAIVVKRDSRSNFKTELDAAPPVSGAAAASEDGSVPSCAKTRSPPPIKSSTASFLPYFRTVL